MSQSGSKRPASKQRLLPLFVMALSLMSVGFYFAFEDALEPLQGEDHEPWVASAPAKPDLPELIAADSTESDFPSSAHLKVRKAHQGGFVLHLEQESRLRKGNKRTDPLKTRIRAEGVEKAPSSATRPDRSVSRRREQDSGYISVLKLEKVAIEVGSQSTPLADSITQQVEKMVAGVAAELRRAPGGKVESLQWQGSVNPEIKKTLDLIGDAILRLLPRFRNEAVNVGESWSYVLPIQVAIPQLDASLSAKAVYRNRFAGWSSTGRGKHAIIVQDVELSGALAGKGALSLGNVHLSGRGKGLVVVDVDLARLMSSALELEQSMKIGQEQEPLTVRETITRMSLQHADVSTIGISE